MSCDITRHITSHDISHCMTHHITSHHITSHHITSHYITSHHITSHHITSHHITSHHITSHHITSHHITLHHITSHHITSHAFLPGQFRLYADHPCACVPVQPLRSSVFIITTTTISHSNITHEPNDFQSLPWSVLTRQTGQTRQWRKKTHRANLESCWMRKSLRFLTT